MRIQRFLLAGLVITALAFPLLAQTQAAGAQEAQEEKGIDLIWGLKIPMRDGVQLNATVYKPKAMREPLPVVLTATPYISDSSHGRAYYFAQNGYVSVVVDVRGRGNSGGEFEERVNESRDGYDVVEWLARQPWSNGKVAMWGGSYRTEIQWLTLKEFPPHLATIVASMGGMPGPWERNNIWGGGMAWLTGVSGVTRNRNLSRERSFWHQKLLERYLEHRPLREFDKIVGNMSTVWQKHLDHPVPDAYWDAMVPTVDDYKRINIPILTVTGHYDGRQRGALEYYRRHMAYGTPEGREKHYVIISPSGHNYRALEVGGLKFGEASRLDWNKLYKEWYDWTMKDGPKPEFLQKRVAYYVTGPGAEEWKYADSLEAIATEKQTLYLQSDGRANDAFHSGFLSEQEPSQSPPDKYVYDPLDVRPAELEREQVEDYLTDQRYALNLFGNGLVYHSEPFPEATEITGQLKFVAWMAMDVPDTDFRVDVYEIQPDGTSILLSWDRMRARYRESLRQEKLVQPGEINRYEFNSFRFFARRIAKGSRLRLLLRSPNSITWQKNYNSGGVVAEESGKDARTAHITLYHDAEHPSFLELPVVKSRLEVTDLLDEARDAARYDY